MLYVAIRCPECFPERPPDCPVEEFGDYFWFGWVPQIVSAVRRRGKVRVTNYDAQWQPTSIDYENFDWLVNSCREKLRAKRGIITKRAATLGWNTPKMKAYIRRICECHLMDVQKWSPENPEGYERSRAPFPRLHPALTVDDVRPLVDELPTELREAFLARHPDKPGPLSTNSWSTVSDLLGVDVSKARRRVAKAIRTMIARLESATGRHGVEEFWQEAARGHEAEEEEVCA